MQVVFIAGARAPKLYSHPTPMGPCISLIYYTNPLINALIDSLTSSLTHFYSLVQTPCTCLNYAFTPHF